MKGLLLNILIIIFLFNTNIYAQRNNTWYFGDKAGISFNEGKPVAITNSAMNQLEGTATISDTNGNLLFYTDGLSVWNTDHQVMPNGTGLKGNYSSTQSALVIPKPGDCRSYFIFTTSGVDGTVPFCYSVIDMNKEGGLGDVVIKNIPVYPGSAERVTGTLHADGKSYWVIAQEWGTNAVLSFNVSSAGVSVPVLSRFPALGLPAPADPNSYVGYMKLSGNGKKLCYTISADNPSSILMDFDTKTGMASNPVVLTHPEWGYGVEFSPDNTKLYISGNGSIWQYDISAGSPEAIRKSRVTIYDRNPQYGGALQLGPDNKIYVAMDGSSSLSAINYPDRPGSLCDYAGAVISLNGRICHLGLPNLIPGLNTSRIYLGNDTIICSGSSILLQSPATGTYSWYRRITQDAPFIFYSNASGIQVADSGSYLLELMNADDCVVKRDTIQIHIAENPVFDLGNDTFICEGNSFHLDAGAGYAGYLWQDGSQYRRLAVNAAGTYSVTVKDEYHCSSSDTILLSVKPAPIIQLPALIEACEPDITLTPGTFTSYLWQDDATSNSYHATGYGLYSVTVTDSNFCSSAATTEIVNDCPGNIHIPNAFTPNADGVNDIFIPVIMNIRTIHLRIYNRWGMLVFETHELNKGWDGNYEGIIASPDVYVYLLEYSDNGSRNIWLSRSGNVSLMR